MSIAVRKGDTLFIKAYDEPATVKHVETILKRMKAGSEGKRYVTTLAMLYEVQGGRCAYCLELMWLPRVKSGSTTLSGKYRATIDHIVPKSKGGSSRFENLAACCSRCNHHKDDGLAYPIQEAAE